MSDLEDKARFDFGVAAANIYAEFPHLRERTFIYDIQADKLSGEGPLFNRCHANQIIVVYSDQDMGIRDYLRADSKASSVMPFGDFEILSFKSGGNNPFWSVYRKGNDVADTFVVDHETGHIVMGALNVNDRIVGTDIRKATVSPPT